MKPTELRVKDAGKALEILWADGVSQTLSAASLRNEGRSAGDVRSRVDGRAVDAADDIAMTGIDPVGHYAINIKFSDGNDRGIYPWSLLRDMSAQ